MILLRPQGTRLIAGLAIFIVLALVVGIAGTAQSAPAPLSISASGANGVGRIDRPGVPCSEGGSGASWRYQYGSALPSGAFSALTGDFLLNLNVHSEASGAPVAGYNGAWMPPGQSFASIGNTRGTLRLGLTAGAGTCGQNALGFDGTTISGSGVWSVGQGTGAYRQATGSGSFTIPSAGVAPGADNLFQIQMNGSVEVLLPSLKLEVVSTYWGFAGLHYVSRIVTVVYRITNTGPGDAFNVRLVTATSPTSGVTSLGPVPQKLGDLLAGESELVRLRYQFQLASPCSFVILGCEFDSRLGVEMPDALDRAATYSATVRARAPDFPPPL